MSSNGASNGSKVSEWVSTNTTKAQVKGIPNFFSKSMFGNTSELKTAAQFAVVWAVVAVILRIFSRRRMKTRIWWDDVCTIGAVFFLVTNQTVFSMIDYLGKTSFAFVGKADQMEERRRLAKIVVGLKLSLAFEVMYLISIYLVKFGMLFLYTRFARHTKHIMLYLRITQGVCGITFAVCILSLFLSCIPISMFWSITNTNEQCTRRTLLTFTSGISNIVTNTLVLAVPVPLLFRANLTLRQRIGVSILYFFGAFVIVASALRFATQLLNVSVPQAIGWSQIEISLAIILACAPMCTKLLLAPLIDPREMEKASESSQFVETPTRLTSKKSAYAQYEDRRRNSASLGRSPLANQPFAARQASFSVPGNQLPDPELRDEPAPPKYGRKNSGLSIETNNVINGGVLSPGDVGTPEYQRLKVVRAEINGQSVWKVRPVSPGTPGTPGTQVQQQQEKADS